MTFCRTVDQKFINISALLTGLLHKTGVFSITVFSFISGFTQMAHPDNYPAYRGFLAFEDRSALKTMPVF